jgi:hypothetical protein
MVGIVHTRKDPNAISSESLPGGSDELKRRLFVSKLDPRPPDADLLQEEQIGVTDPGWHPVRQLDIAGVMLVYDSRPGLRSARRPNPGRARREWQLEKVSPGCICHKFLPTME